MIQIVGEPSNQFMKEMGDDEKKRVEDQCKSLGPEGLQRCKTTLEQSIANNEVGISLFSTLVFTHVKEGKAL